MAGEARISEKAERLAQDARTKARLQERIDELDRILGLLEESPCHDQEHVVLELLKLLHQPAADTRHPRSVTHSLTHTRDRVRSVARGESHK